MKKFITEKDISEVVERFAASRGVSVPTAGTLLAGDGNLVNRLRAGCSLTIRRAHAIIDNAREQWPEDSPLPDILKET